MRSPDPVRFEHAPDGARAGEMRKQCVAITAANGARELRQVLVEGA
jgi:hypothetical protein